MASSSTRFAFGIICVLVLVGAPPAAAHDRAAKYVDLAVDGTLVRVSVRFAPADVLEPMGLRDDAKPGVIDATFHPAVPRHVQTWLTLEGCAPSRPTGVPGIDPRHVVVTWTATCTPRNQSRSIENLSLDFSVFFANAEHHAVLMLVRATGLGPRRSVTVARASQPRVVIQHGEAPPAATWVGSGMQHIYGGVDHVLFVISLLLVMMLARREGEIDVRAFVPTVRHAALVITAFTLSHSLTLIAASLGVISLPSRLVETLIAASIVYTAAENVVNPTVRWRYVLAFAFGLVHGLGFASVLAEILPPTDIVVPLLLFNLGVELGQLSIVAVVLPLLFGIARSVGVLRYRRTVLPILSIPILVVGIVMVIERIFDLTLLPRTG